MKLRHHDSAMLDRRGEAADRRDERWRAARAREGLGPRHDREPGWVLLVGVVLIAAAAALWLFVGLDVPLGRRTTTSGFVFAILLVFGAVLTFRGAHDLLRDRRDRAAGRPTDLSPEGESFVDLGEEAGDASRPSADRDDPAR